MESRRLAAKLAAWSKPEEVGVKFVNTCDNSCRTPDCVVTAVTPSWGGKFARRHPKRLVSGNIGEIESAGRRRPASAVVETQGRRRCFMASSKTKGPADAERQRADAERQRADAERQRADALAQEVERLRRQGME